MRVTVRVLSSSSVLKVAEKSGISSSSKNTFPSTLEAERIPSPNFPRIILFPFSICVPLVVLLLVKPVLTSSDFCP